MRILVALDESAVSARAAREAVRLFGTSGAEFLVINVARTPNTSLYPTDFGAVAPMPHDAAYLSDQAELHAAALADQVGLADAEVITDLGDPASSICDAADAHNVDVVVVGSHDRGVIGRLLEPSVAAGVVRGTHRPVLVVSGSPPA
ncbi:MAG: universal stress protein [Actinobacteria bacterium]|nr:universal stress protein [Actinomycetota bacterium]